MRWTLGLSLLTRGQGPGTWFVLALFSMSVRTLMQYGYNVTLSTKEVSMLKNHSRLSRASLCLLSMLALSGCSQLEYHNPQTGETLKWTSWRKEVELTSGTLTLKTTTRLPRYEALMKAAVAGAVEGAK